MAFIYLAPPPSAGANVRPNYVYEIEAFSALRKYHIFSCAQKFVFDPYPR